MKNLKPLLMLIGLSLISPHLFAQKTATFKFDTNLYIRHASSYGYAVVIDKRPDQTNLGILRTGAFERRNVIKTEGDFSTELAAYANGRLQHTVKGTDTLLIVLSDCEVADREDNPISTLYFKAAFFLGGNDQYYLTKDVDSIYETNGGGTMLLKGMADKIFGYLDQVAAADEVSGRKAKSYSGSEAANIFETRRLSNPIYQATDFKPGIYFTVEQFLSNSPVDTPIVQGVHVLDDINRPFFYYRKGKAKKGERVAKYFAIYTGKEWWAYESDGAFTARFEHGDFYARQYFHGLPGKVAGGVGMAFGLVGVLVETAIEAAENSRGNPKKILYLARLNPEERRFCPVKRLR